MKMALAMPLADIMSYRKVGRAYFSLLDVLCHNHVATLATSDTRTFAFLMTSLDQGLRSLEVTISSQCASAVDNLAGFYFKQVVAAEESPTPAAQVWLVIAIQRTNLDAAHSFGLFITDALFGGLRFRLG